MFERHAILVGKVEHRRIKPVRHRLSYDVFSILVNLDTLEEVDKLSAFFSINKPNLLALHIADLADGNQTDLSAFARSKVSEKYPEIEVEEVWLQTYPRVLGYVFNPLSVYICLNVMKKPVAAVYEVSNTFGDRIHYVQRVDNGQIDRAQKQMLVSPFNEKVGEYGFSLLAENDDLTIGVSLRQAGEPLLKTWFKACQRPVSNYQIFGLMARMPFLTMKVIAAIHFEALKLWIKGLRPPKKPATVPNNVFGGVNSKQEPKHAAEG